MMALVFANLVTIGVFAQNNNIISGSIQNSKTLLKLWCAGNGATNISRRTGKRLCVKVGKAIQAGTKIGLCILGEPTGGASARLPGLVEQAGRNCCIVAFTRVFLGGIGPQHPVLVVQF